MTNYSIPVVVIDGVVFRGERLLSLQEAVRLARELNSRGYVFNVYEEVPGQHNGEIPDKPKYECRSLNDLEKVLKKQS